MVLAPRHRISCLDVDAATTMEAIVRVAYNDLRKSD
jgi:hypothetical protein